MLMMLIVSERYWDWERPDMRGAQRCVVCSCLDVRRQEAETQDSGREERWRCLNDGVFC